MCNSREFVVNLLTKMDKNGSYSNLLIDENLDKSNLSPKDKKFACALFYGTLERRITLDGIIENLLKNPGKKIDIFVRNVLRTAVYQLKYMDSVPENAAVNEAVLLAKKCKNPSYAGFVNAILREFIRRGKNIPQTKRVEDRFILEYSAPNWLVNKWIEEYGEEICENMLKHSLGKSPNYVRINTVFNSLDDVCLLLDEEGVLYKKCDFLQNCMEISLENGVENLESFKRGFFHVQDISSQLCCAAVEPKEGETVLDICAAPGGKSFTMAEIMGNKGKVLAFDIYEKRVNLIKQSAKRLGLDCIEANVNNGMIYNEKIPKADKILCDVPCSGLGVIRRKPEIKYKSLEDFRGLPKIQYEILNTSAKYLKAGGNLVYSTCTLSRAENDEVVGKFLKENPEFSFAPLGKIFGDNCECCKITITPDKYGSDGFFIAKLTKRE